jgi:glycosyltransferase involved in cell wall biosynthesis
VVGNSILAAAARPYSREVVILPTTLDPAGYHTVPRVPGGPPTIVWVGNPENIAYLELVRSALERLSVRHPGLRLRVISSAFPEWPNVRIERIPWSPESEVQALATADIGIMPLTDDDWSRGKCAFKLLQYMAASLPCVASPVGANYQAIIEGKTGFLAASTSDGVNTSFLYRSDGVHERLGKRARQAYQRSGDGSRVRQRRPPAPRHPLFTRPVHRGL